MHGLEFWAKIRSTRLFGFNRDRNELLEWVLTRLERVDDDQQSA